MYLLDFKPFSLFVLIRIKLGKTIWTSKLQYKTHKQI